MKYNKENLAIVFALQEETSGLFDDLKPFYTGLGKINASLSLAKILHESKPAFVLNLGTAGSRKFCTHALIECSGFVQRDMDLSALGFQPGETPFDSISGQIKGTRLFENLKHGICGSGDSFETGEPKIPCDLVDMEAYAMAKTCKIFKCPFISVKYITDGCDHKSGDEWSNNLKMASLALRGFANDFILSLQDPTKAGMINPV